ncbi:hypothetical protein HOP50_15g74850 [Chloropicon primus]|uniref:J domain-containing protein n=1 Tax=Chloropicon primus TaxID=1764295 RepID=A0A5B8MZ93_9CHLO|nr:hypothetical protein A3770_15p74600 [Chloropicon primus]UPR04151.1 hypothetical protein HOP50_15g74850 [Chloropicon primus]|mmetsp:Transcript_3027/g.8196  ORF Transcript_3027/g.8196 Transcript_3027/m.8196 type:complete len:267 (+) Transcript_3027:83-883(+)|eukprot:QDZ24942.1 hypothetical protein A3770_15p74600 [Chloropicon primus]
MQSARLRARCGASGRGRACVSVRGRRAALATTTATTTARRLGQSRRHVRVSAAAEDPYSILGVAPGADSEAINRAYKSKIATATTDDEKKAIETAHTSIMMSSLSARLQGGGSAVAKEIRYADRAPMFRWRPRLHMCEQKDILINGGIWAAAVYWANKSTYSPWQPLMLGFAVLFIRMNYKLMPLMPRPATDDRKEIRNADTKRLGRAFGVVGGLFALFAGVVSFVPQVLMALRLTVPMWLLGSLYEFSVGVAGLVGSMIGASFCR